MACAVLPGALGGIELAVLLFFLNPQWPFQPLPVAAAMLRYGSLLAAASTTVLLPLLWRRPALGRRLLPWALVLVFGCAGLLFWVHASYFSLFLPAGINRRLIKAALWLSLAAVLAFYTALLHTVPRRRYSPLSVFGFVLLALLVNYAILERREAFHPTVGVTPRPSAVAPLERPNLLVVGLASASLDVVLPLAEQGQLPFFGAALRDGAYGRLETLEPTRDLPLWASLATGKFPYRHGVVSSQRYAVPFLAPGAEFQLTPIGIGFEHWGVSGGALPNLPDLRSLPVWEICERLGLEPTVVGWPGSVATAEDRIDPGLDTVASVPEGVDPRWQSVAELDPGLVPALADDERRMRQVLRIEESRRDATQPIVVFVALEGMQAVSLRTFGGYSAVHFDGRQERQAAAASEALEGAYAYYDGLLAQAWARLPEPRLLLVVSPYGIRRPPAIRRLVGLVQHQRRFEGLISGAPDGLLLLRGGMVRSGFLPRLQITDAVPTILYGLGFPSARDFDGRVLTEGFAPKFLQRNPLTVVPSYETTLGVRR